MPGDGGRSARPFAIILVVHLAVVVLWQVLVDAFHVPKFILPSPLAALSTLAYAKYAWASNLLVTAVGWTAPTALLGDTAQQEIWLVVARAGALAALALAYRLAWRLEGAVVLLREALARQDALDASLVRTRHCSRRSASPDPAILAAKVSWKGRSARLPRDRPESDRIATSGQE